MQSSEHLGTATLLVLSTAAALVTAGLISAFVISLRSGKLSTLGKLVFGLGLVCGVGALPAIALGWKAVQSGAYEVVENGGDPRAAHLQTTYYKVSVAVMVCGVMLGVFAR